MRTLSVAILLLALAGCASPPERPEATLRQALFGLGESAARRILDAPVLPRPHGDQVLLVSLPAVDDELSIGEERLRESLGRALLGASDGPQVLDWRPAMAEEAAPHQWRLESRLEAEGPRLRLSDRELLPYRLKLSLHRPDEEPPRWESEISGAIDATAL